MSDHYDRQTGDSVSDEDRVGQTRPPQGSGPSPHAAKPPGRPGSPGLTRLTGWFAAVAIAASTLIMIVISAAGPNVSVPAMRRAGGLPWWHALHLTATFVTVSLWGAMVLGCAGVMAGLVAVARGARPPVRPVIAAAFLAVVVLTVLQMTPDICRNVAWFTSSINWHAEVFVIPFFLSMKTWKTL